MGGERGLKNEEISYICVCVCVLMCGHMHVYECVCVTSYEEVYKCLYLGTIRTEDNFVIPQILSTFSLT